MKQLTDQQVRFAPPARRQEQLVRGERLMAEIEPAKLYPYQFVCFRITDFRPDSYPDLLISGADLKHDLVAFLEEVSRSLPAVPVEEVAEPILTLEEISHQLNVSTKTISRWRERGLVGRRVLCNGRRQLGFMQSTVDRFLEANRTAVERGGRFSQLSDDEKEQILVRAKRLSRFGGASLTEVSRRIGRRLGRSPETVRYTIKNYDREHPEQPLFPEVTGPLSQESKDTIYNSFRRGMSVETLAKRFHRTRNSVYRIVNEVRARRLLGQPLEYIYHVSFDDPALEADILAPMPDARAYEMQRRSMKVPKDAPPELASLYEVPLLSKEQEQQLFRQMNFLKHRAALLRKQLDPAHARIQDLQQIEEFQQQATAVKDRLINCNMRLVVSVAKRHAGQAENFFELLSDGNMSLIRAVEKFDFSRGNKFSTYACWAIMKNYARSIPDDKKRRERYVTGHEEMFEATADSRSNEHEQLYSQEQAASRVNRLLETLDDRERQIIRMRAGLDNYSEGMTLEEIGLQLGITKERVRQLNVRIMNKLRSTARDDHGELQE
jgi:RNA polymerase sigma factor (sigma-70 family)